MRWLQPKVFSFCPGIPKMPSKLLIPMYSCTISLSYFLNKTEFLGHPVMVLRKRGKSLKLSGRVAVDLHRQRCLLSGAPGSPPKNGSIFWTQKKHPNPHLRKPQVHDITFSTFCQLGVQWNLPKTSRFFSRKSCIEPFQGFIRFSSCS